MVHDLATLTYDQKLDETSVPDADDFTVTGQAPDAAARVSMSHGATGTVTTTSTASRIRHGGAPSLYGWQGLSSSIQAAGSDRIGVLAVELADRTVSLSLARQVGAGENVSVSYTPGANPIRSASGGTESTGLDEAPLQPAPEPGARLFDLGHAARHGFVRIINHSASTGRVQVGAIDGSGVVSDALALVIGPGEVRHFNARDLAGGTGAGLGGARLEVSSELDVEVLSYARTSSGVVTALHEAVREETGGVYRLPFFNPGTDADHVSRLRLTNEGAVDARATVTGVDDTGAPSGEVVIDVPARATVDVTAADLESGTGVHGSLGAGMGKWRLTLTSGQPLTVLNLLESADGLVANLSTAPRLRGTQPGSLAVPLFPSAADAMGRQGLVRIINQSPRAGEVVISARDDSTWHYDPLTLHLAAGAAVHIDSDDLELGSAEKGLTGRTGAGEGTWRLELESELEIDVLSYVRTSDGFVVPMHDVAPKQDRVYRTAFFNPGSNGGQASSLRLVNFGERTAAVRLTATDDKGKRPGTPVLLTVAALSAVELTAAELESGTASAIRSGAFADGSGKWRVRIESDVPLHVLSLLSNPGGYLTNVSTASPSRGFDIAPGDG